MPSSHGIDMRDLPSLVPEDLRNDSARAVSTELGVRVSKLEDKVNSGVFEDMSSQGMSVLHRQHLSCLTLVLDDSPKTKCSFQLFAQLVPSTIPREQMEELEREFEEPTGISTVRAPEFALEGVLLSQNCGMLYEIKHAEGVQTQRLYGKITTCASPSFHRCTIPDP